MLGAVGRAGSRMLNRVALPSRTALRRSHDHHKNYTVPGENLPFDISNPYKLTVYFALFCGSAIAIPFIAVRHQLLKS